MSTMNDDQERIKARSKRWQKLSQWRWVHDDGSIITASNNGWWLRAPAIGSNHGPFKYFDDARNFHANTKLTP